MRVLCVSLVSIEENLENRQRKRRRKFDPEVLKVLIISSNDISVLLKKRFMEGAVL